MKKLLAIFTFVALALTMSGCGESGSSGGGSSMKTEVVGEWHLVAWSEGKPEYLDVYLNLKSNSTFDLYQRVESHKYQKLSGRYLLSGNTLTGKYDDGETLGGEPYTVEIKGEQLRMTAASGDVSTYEKCTIPSEIRAASAEQAAVRSEGAFRFL